MKHNLIAIGTTRKSAERDCLVKQTDCSERAAVGINVDLDAVAIGGDLGRRVKKRRLTGRRNFNRHLQLIIWGSLSARRERDGPDRETPSDVAREASHDASGSKQ